MYNVKVKRLGKHTTALGLLTVWSNDRVDVNT